MIRLVTESFSTITNISGRRFIKNPLATAIIDFFRKTYRLKSTFQLLSVGGNRWVKPGTPPAITYEVLNPSNFNTLITRSFDPTYNLNGMPDELAKGWYTCAEWVMMSLFAHANWFIDCSRTPCKHLLLVWILARYPPFIMLVTMADFNRNSPWALFKRNESFPSDKTLWNYVAINNLAAV